MTTVKSANVPGCAVGAPVEERFDHQSGTARWQSTLESGRVESPLVRFYLANEHTPEETSALARAMLAVPEGTPPLWLSRSAPGAVRWWSATSGSCGRWIAPRWTRSGD